MRRRFIGLAALASTLLLARPAWSCFVASQDVRLLLGSSDEGLVWAVLHMQRDDVEGKRKLRWRIDGRVEVAAPNGSRARELTQVGRPHWTLFEGSPGSLDAPLSSELGALAKRITLPGFRGVTAVRVLDCDAAQSCGPWRLERTPGALAIVGTQAKDRLPVPLPADFVGSAQDGETSEESARAVRAGLMLVGISEYRLGADVVRVFNLGYGDRHFYYGDEASPAHADPTEIKPTGRCKQSGCPPIHPTLHHGAHLEVAAIPTPAP
jgi:hypothetical protein